MRSMLYLCGISYLIICKYYQMILRTYKSMNIHLSFIISAMMAFAALAAIAGLADTETALNQEIDSYNATIDVTADLGRERAIGETAQFTISAYFPGNGSWYRSVEIEDAIPSGLIYEGWECQAESDCGSFSKTSKKLRWRLQDFQGPKSVVIKSRFRIKNTSTYQDGDILNNSVRLYYEDGSGRPFIANDRDYVRIVEPDLDITMDVTYDSDIQAGATLRYTIKVHHSTTSHSSAYDVIITDSLPEGLTILDTVSADPRGDLVEDGRKLIWSFDGLMLDQEAVLIFDALVSPDVVMGQPLKNVASVTWTSTSGPNPYERYGGGPSPNNYDSATSRQRSIDNSPSISKTPDSTRRLVIGSEGYYNIGINLPGATARQLWVNDTVPPGLIYDPASLEISGGSMPQRMIVSSPNDGSKDVTIAFEFGDFNNSDDHDLNIRYNFTVADTFDNENGAVTGESCAVMEWNSYTSRHVKKNCADGVEIVEPDLSLDKSASTSEVETGSLVAFSMKFYHTPSSTSEAYDLEISDIVPDGTTFVSQTSSPRAVFSHSGNVLRWTLPSLSKTWSGSKPASISFTVAVNRSVSSGKAIGSTASLTWTGIRGPNPKERYGGWNSLDDYNRTSEASVFVKGGATIGCLPDNRRSMTIGGQVNYTILGILPRALLEDVWINATIPRGLIYDKSSFCISGSGRLKEEIVNDRGGAESPSEVYWHLGDVDNSFQNNIEVDLAGIVTDVPGNINGAVIWGLNASLSWLGADGQRKSSVDSSGPLEIVEPRLAVTKTADPEESDPNSSVSYILRISHCAESRAPAYDLVVSDTLPAGLDIIADSVGSSPNAKWTLTNGNTITWQLDKLNVGTALTLSYRAAVSADPGTVLKNDAVLNWTSTQGPNPHERSGDGYGTGRYNAFSAAEVLVMPVSLTVRQDPDQVVIGGAVNYTIRYSNLGDSPISGMTISWDPDPRLLSVSADPPPCEALLWNGSCGTVIDPLNSGQDGEIRIYALTMPPARNGTTLTSTAAFSYAGIEPRKVLHETVVLAPDLKLDISCDREEVVAGDPLNCTICYRNAGLVEATGVSLTASYDPGLSFVEADPEPCDHDGCRWTGSCSDFPERLHPGENGTIEAAFRVNETLRTGTRVEGKFTIECRETDPVSGSSIAHVNNPNTVELSVTKRALQTTYERGEEMTYLIRVCNPSRTVPARDVLVKDVMPRGMLLVSATPMPSDGGVWHFDLIPPRGCVNITVTAIVPRSKTEFGLESGVEGVGFVNRQEDLSTTVEPDSIKNCVYATAEGGRQISNCASVTLAGEPGTELRLRGHGSGIYTGRELLQYLTENKSIQMRERVSAVQAPTSFSLPRKRTQSFNSSWSETVRGENLISGAKISEEYRYASSLERDGKIALDMNGSIAETEAEIEGSSRISLIKDNSSSPEGIPVIASCEDYTGSFRIHERAEEYGEHATVERSISGTGYAATETQIGGSQRFSVSGTGEYESRDDVRTHTGYVARSANVTQAPVSFSLPLAANIAINRSLAWADRMQSISRSGNIHQEFSEIERMRLNVTALGPNEMETSANFSGRTELEAHGEGSAVSNTFTGNYSIWQWIQIGDRSRCGSTSYGKIHGLQSHQCAVVDQTC